MLGEFLVPQIDADGTAHFALPLADGAVPFVALDDFGKYVHWAFKNPAESASLDIGIAVAHVPGSELAEAFTAVTGRKADYVDLPIDVWLEHGFGKLPQGIHTKIGHRGTTDQSSLTLTFAQNFENWWNLYKGSAGNNGVITRDYELLDRILPERIRSVEDWMRKTEYTGEKQALLKSTQDGSH